MTMRVRATARAKGLRMAARIAGLGGLALAAAGIAEARATEAAAVTAPGISAPGAVGAPIANDVKVLPLEGWLRETRGGNCGCSPCWGPPAPPARSARPSARRTRRRTRRATRPA